MQITFAKILDKQSLLILCALFITQFPFCTHKIAVDPRNALMPLNDQSDQNWLSFYDRYVYMRVKAVIIHNMCLIVCLIVCLIFITLCPSCTL